MSSGILQLTIEGPYARCEACSHPGPPEKVHRMSIMMPEGATQPDGTVFVPHYPGCGGLLLGAPGYGTVNFIIR